MQKALAYISHFIQSAHACPEYFAGGGYSFATHELWWLGHDEDLDRSLGKCGSLATC